MSTLPSYKLAMKPVQSVLFAALIGIGVAGTSHEVAAQDMRFTQYNAIPTAVNPAYAGVMDRARLVSIYRDQWSGMPNGFVGYHVGYDWNNRDINSGFGVLFSKEQAGAGALSTTRIALQYAYDVNFGNGWSFRPSLQIGGANRSVDMGRLIFGDQLITEDQVSIEGPIGASNSYLDFATGGLIIGPSMWLGYSADHVNTPNASLYEGYTELLPVKHSAHGGFRMDIGANNPKVHSNADFVVAFNYMKQGIFDQMDVGMYYDLKPLSVGLWWRGLPIGHTVEGGHDVDALSFIIGYGTNDWQLGYSYDITVSTLGLSTTGGSHELVLRYQWDHDRRNRPSVPRAMPCASF